MQTPANSSLTHTYPASVPAWWPALRNLVLGALLVLPLAFGLKLVAGMIGGGTTAIDIDPILATFTNPMLLVFAAINAAFFIIEAFATGWQGSSLRRLVILPTDEAKGDVFFILMTYSGASAALITIMSGGMVDAAVAALGAQSHTGLLADAPAWLAAPVLYVCMTFFDYWFHRFMHTPLMWQLHALHHASREFTVFNSNRVSLADLILGLLAVALPAALLGASPEAIFYASLMFGNEALLLHCNFPGLAWLERFYLTSPDAHRIHHGLDERYHDYNFANSLLGVWDRLFGTYMPSSVAEGPVEIGVHDPEGIYTSGHALRNVALTHWVWARDRARAMGLVR